MARGGTPKIPPTTVFVGQLPVFEPDTPEGGDDFRNVPASDRGNADYSDRGMLGNYSPEMEPYRSPSDVLRFSGYGADEADLDRGYATPVMREQAAYDSANYRERWTAPKQQDEDDNPATASADNFAFRRRHERSRGFFTRPRIPTDR